MRRRLLGAVSLWSLFAAGHIFAQAGAKPSSPAELNPLSGATSLKCRFTLGTIGSWLTDGTPSAEIKSGRNSSIDIDQIDADGGTARMGAEHVVVLLTESSLHFLSRTFQGNLSVTTVFSLKTPTGAFKAVRSGHDYLQMAIPGFVAAPTVSQQYGECEVGR